MSITTSYPADIGTVCSWRSPDFMWAVCGDQSVPRGFPSATPVFDSGTHAATVVSGEPEAIASMFAKARLRMLAARLLSSIADERSVSMLLACWVNEHTGVLIALESPGDKTIQDFVLAVAQDHAQVHVERHLLFDPINIMSPQLRASVDFLNQS